MTETVDYEYWNDFLFREGAVCSPAELQGAMLASLCISDTNWKDLLKDVLDVPEAELSTQMQAALEALRDICASALSKTDFSLALLLPDDALPLADRCRALADWCHGFLFGFAQNGETTAKKLDEDLQDSITDMAKIAQVEPSATDDDDTEQELFELIEYVRLAVVGIYAQLNPAPSISTNSLH